jgi:hypothetical protein
VLQKKNFHLTVFLLDNKVFEFERKKERNGLVIALRPQTPKHSRGGWSQYTDTSEPVDGRAGTLQS